MKDSLILKYFKRTDSQNRAKLIIRMLRFCANSPLSIREISSILNADNRTVRYYLIKLRKFVEKKYNIGFCLNKKGKKIAKNINTKLDPTYVKVLTKIKKRKHYYYQIYNDWKKILNKKSKIKNQLLFHWYNLPSNFTLDTDKVEFKNFLDKLKRRFDIKSDRQFALNLGYNEKLIWRYRKGLDNPTVKSLKRICDFTKIGYETLEKDNLFKTKFPIKICKTIFQLKTHLINEGNLRDDGAIYHNYDPILLKNFQNCIKHIKRKIYEPKFSKKDIYILTDRFTSQLVQFTGVKSGKTSKINPTMSGLEKQNFKIFKKHMQITLAEEGTIHLALHKKYNKSYIGYCIGLSRAVDVSKDAPKVYKDNLPYGFLTFTKLPVKIQSILIKRRCNLLDDEISCLYKFFKFKNKSFMPKPSGIYKAKNGNVTLYWIWATQNFELINILQKLIFPDSWAYRKAQEFYKIWLKYHSKPLSSKELNEVGMIRKYFNTRGVPNWWIKEKMKEYFPLINIRNFRQSWKK